MRLPRLNITLKFIIYLMFISVIPLVVVGIVSYSTSSNLLQQSANRFSEQLVANQTDLLDLQLAQIESLMINLAGVEDIRQTLLDQDAANTAYTRLATQAEIGNILNRYITSVPQLVSINIFSLQGQNYYVGDTLNVDDIREDIRESAYNEALASDQSVYWQGIEPNINANSNIEYVITASEVIYNFNRELLQQEPIGFFLVTYNIDDIYERFSTVDLGNDGYMLVVDSKRRYVYHPRRDLIGTIASPEIQSIFSSHVDGTTVTEISSVATVVNYTHSDLTGWVVAAFTPVETLTADVDSIRTATLAVVIASLMVVAAVAWFYDSTVVAPIREITQRFQRLQDEPADQQARMVARSKDEVGELVTWFNSFLDNLVMKDRAELALIERIVFEQLVTQISTEFINVAPQKIDATIEKALDVIGRANQLDAIYVCLLPDKEFTQLPIKHHWHLDKTESPEHLSSVPLKPWLEWLQDHQAVYIPDSHRLDETRLAEKDYLLSLGIKSLVSVPIATADVLKGFIMFASLQEKRVWAEENIGLLELVGQIVGTALERQRVENERQQLVDELRTANEMAQESSRLKSEFLATMSHELRTPLNAIQGFTSILIEGLIVEVPAEAVNMLERIHANSKRLLALINDVLDISRIEAGRMQLSPTSLDPRQLVETWRKEVSVLAEQKGLTFEINYSDKLPKLIEVDPDALSKVVLNLLSNAFKFTHEGQVTLNVDRNEQYWILQVTDTGIGIPDDAAEYIFDEFRQVDQSSTRAYGGTGLGLSIVYKIVRAMGGDITLVSAVGTGSIFTVTLPIKSPLLESEIKND